MVLDINFNITNLFICFKKEEKENYDVEDLLTDDKKNNIYIILQKLWIELCVLY